MANMPTTATQAMQLWFKQPIEALAGMPSLVGEGGVRPFYYGSANFPGEMHGILDFTKYLEFENWGADEPGGLLYGCGVRQPSRAAFSCGSLRSPNWTFGIEGEMSAALFHMVGGGPRPVAPFSHATEVDGWVFVTGWIWLLRMAWKAALG